MQRFTGLRDVRSQVLCASPSSPHTEAMTWGISGKEFLLIYAVLLLTVLFTNAWLRRRAMQGGPRVTSRTPPPLGLDELAYLAGGADALGASALVGLCEQGAVHAGRERRVVADDLGPDLAATAAQCALYDELVHVGGVQVRYAGELLKNTRTLKVIRHTLAAHELVPGDRLRACNRLGALNFALLLLLGVVRVGAGLHGHHPFEYLILLMIATVFLGIRTLRVPRVTPGGRALLQQTQEDAKALLRDSRPGDRALAVALFGVGALWQAAPSIAAELGFARG